MADRKCQWCGGALPAGVNANRTLCSSRCKKAIYYYRNKSKVDAKQKKRNKTKQGRTAIARYKNSNKGKQTSRAGARRAGSERAIALLLLPTKQPPKV